MQQRTQEVVNNFTSCGRKSSGKSIRNLSFNMWIRYINIEKSLVSRMFTGLPIHLDGPFSFFILHSWFSSLSVSLSLCSLPDFERSRSCYFFSLHFLRFFVLLLMFSFIISFLCFLLVWVPALAYVYLSHDINAFRERKSDVKVWAQSAFNTPLKRYPDKHIHL